MGIRLRSALLSLVVLMTAFRAEASGGDRVPGSRWVSGRGAAMGDAFISFADDGPGALFYNPAAIARLRDVYFEPLNLQLQANGDLGAAIGSESWNFHSLDSYQSRLARRPGTNPGGSGAVVSSVSFQGMAVGLLMQSRLRATYSNGNITYRSVYQIIPAAGAGLSLASGVLRLGYVLQYVNQASGEVTTAATATPLGWNQSLAQGSGVSHNLGMALTLPYRYQPAINVVARNLLGVKYSSSVMFGMAENTQGTPPDEEMTLDGSLSFLFKVGGGNEIRTAVDYRDALNSSDTSPLGRAAFGSELAMRDGFHFRLGLGSGYPAAGVGMKTRRSEVNLSWFSEEIGDGFRSARDIRYLFQYRLRAF